MKSIGKALKQIVEAFGKPTAKPVPVTVPPQEIEPGPITRRDKRMIIKHIDELFAMGADGGVQGPITKQDQALIVKHIDELFATGAEGGVQEPAAQAEAGPITEEDQALIVKHIDELFTRSSGSVETPEAEAGPITEEDQALIMEHVHELFSPSDEGKGGRHGEAEASA